MCDDPNMHKARCEPCRTINLASQIRQQRVRMNKRCTPAPRIDCSRITELPVQPTCIRVCTREEYLGIKPKPLPKMPPTYGHGKLMWAVKSGILVGAVYFTYSQGVWGNQQDVTECVRRWQEYIKSMSTRQPPVVDECGKVIKSDAGQFNSILAPLYGLYKDIVTTCFSGVVKVPVLIKCAYVDYLAALDKKHKELVRERQLRRKG